MKPFFLKALVLLILSFLVSGQAMAWDDDYPTSIAGCLHTTYPGGPPTGAPFTGDLKDSIQDSLIDPWDLYSRECTSFCAWRLQSRNGYEIAGAYGDAEVWGTRARREGYTVDMTPAIGAIAWWSSGHVAWVESISADGKTVTVEDYNDEYPNNPGYYKEHSINVNSVSDYIHFKDITGPATDIYVSTTGNDANNGSVNSPLRTVARAIAQASSTQPVTIHITSGTYSENISTSKHILFVTNGSGTVRIGG